MSDGNSRIGALVLDILETWAGDWFTEPQIISMTTSLREGVDVESVERALRRLRAQVETHGWGKAADKITVTTSSGGRRRRCRRVNVEMIVREDSCLLRVPYREYW